MTTDWAEAAIAFVRTFQARAGLSVTGQPSPETWEALDRLRAPPGGPPMQAPTPAERFVRSFQARYRLVADGRAGPATCAALDRVLPARAPDDQDRAGRWPRYNDLRAFFGEPGGPDCTAGRVELPLPFVLAWPPHTEIRHFACHRLVAAPLTTIFREAVAHYGAQQYRELRLHIFGGCYAYRVMRNGSRLSVHAWGAAVDLDPSNNRLDMDHKRALFARPEYAAFWRIVEAQGAVSLGRVRDYDWMHFQFCRLD